MTTKTLSEEQMVGLVRNALLVAGQEMGAEGDHWPVINSTIHSVMKDWEALKVERNVQAEVKKSYDGIIAELETMYAQASDESKSAIRATIDELREICTAAFTDVDQKDFHVSREELPDYIKRAEVIVRTLEDENAA